MSQQNSSYDLNFHKVLGKDTVESGWVRPSEWPEIASLVTANSFVGLYRVDNDLDGESNYCQVYAEVTGGYTVDWGDGVTENVASGVTGTHIYTYSDVDLIDTGLGYKVAIVIVTPQSANNITNFSLANPSFIDYAPKFNTWLDIDMDLASAIVTVTSFNFRSALLEQLSIRACANTDFSFFLSYAPNLKFIPTLDTSNGTSFAYMFDSCSFLKTIPLIDTSGASDLQFMFSDCISLETIPLLDVSNVTNFNYTFNGCIALETIPLLDTSSVTNFARMFYNCTSLAQVPGLNMSNAGSSGLSQTFSNGFGQSCLSLVRCQATFPDSESISFQINKLSGPSLDEIYTNLPTTSDTIFITVYENPGLASHTPSIATGKGWTVLA